MGGSALTQIFDEGRFAADEFFANLTRQLGVQAANAAANQLIGGILGLLTSSITGMFSSTPVGRGYAGYDAALGQHVANVPIHHSGGIVGMGGVPTRTAPMSLFANAPRYHSGGLLRPDERPAILQTGERVLSRSDNADMGAKLDAIAARFDALAAALRDASGGAPNIVIVDDDSKIKKYMRSADGQRDFVFNLNQSRASVQNVAKGGRA